jgi:integrase
MTPSTKNLLVRRRILTDKKRDWYRILDDAKVDLIRFHDLRATYGTRLEEIGVPPGVCMALIGHKRNFVHDRYIRPTLPVLRAAKKTRAMRG